MGDSPSRIPAVFISLESRRGPSPRSVRGKAMKSITAAVTAADAEADTGSSCRRGYGI